MWSGLIARQETIKPVLQNKRKKIFYKFDKKFYYHCFYQCHRIFSSDFNQFHVRSYSYLQYHDFFHNTPDLIFHPGNTW